MLSSIVRPSWRRQQCRIVTNISRQQQQRCFRSLFDGNIWTTAKGNEKIVDNTGSIARDVLAAERTFLAWSRTGLGFVGAGSAMFAAYHRNQNTGTTSWNMNTTNETSDNVRSLLSQQRRQQHIYLASALLVGNGAFLLAFSTRRYLRTISWLLQDKFPIDTKGTLLAIMVTATSTVSSLGLVLHSQYNKRIAPPSTRTNDHDGNNNLQHNDHRGGGYDEEKKNVETKGEKKQ